MIHTHKTMNGDVTLSCDVCVVGSGAGGAPVAAECARAGLRVVVLEAGSYVTPAQFTQLEGEMFARLYHDNACRTTADRTIHVHQGKGVGGSTLHNLNLCKRVPPEVFALWRREGGLSQLPRPRLDALYDEVERRLSVTTLTERDLNPNNRALKDGCERLGYRGGYLRHNRSSCIGSGYCELGCPFDAKQNALKVFLTEAVRDGAEVLADTWATRIETSGRRAQAVEAVVRDPATRAAAQRVRVEARAVCVSASATGTPALLKRSRVPDPHELLGSRLFIHPGTGVAAIFGARLRSWVGVPQSYECTEFLEHAPGAARRVWIISAFAHPAGASALLAGFGREHARILGRYPFLAALSPMVHDQTPGRVGPDPRDGFGVRIDYSLSPDDARQLRLGIVESARILFAAGAARVIVPLCRPLELGSVDEVDGRLGSLELRPHDLDITAVHPMSSVWMGDDPARSCTDGAGRYHHLDNVFVSDTSLFPTSIGGPPQLTAYALGLHVGRTISSTL